jgi:hypothetical protein
MRDDRRPAKTFLYRMNHNSGFQRRVLLRFTGAAVGGIVMISAILIIIALSSSASSPDRLAAAGDLLTGATFLLAVIAAIVALLAYAVSTGVPDIQVSVQFEYSIPNKPVFKAKPDNNGWLTAEAFKQTTGRIVLRNKSSYSAKNPAVIVRLLGMAYHPGASNIAVNKEWTITNAINTVGITEVQWDGGATYSIHGQSVRRLPVLDLVNLQKTPAPDYPLLVFEILAEGYRKEVALPVDFTLDGVSRFEVVNYEKPPEWL